MSLEFFFGFMSGMLTVVVVLVGYDVVVKVLEDRDRKGGSL